MRFQDLLDQHNVTYQTEGKHCRPGWLQMTCPWCLGNLYLGYNLQGGYANCWRCGPHRPWEIIAKAANVPLRKAMEQFQQVSREFYPREIVVNKEFKLPPGVGKLKSAHRNYLLERGFQPDELADLWKIGGIDERGGHLRWRIFIPVFYRGQMVSWTSRSIAKEADTRYFSAGKHEEILSHRELLFGEDYVRHSVIVHEGPFDVFATGPGAVATFGTGLKPAQVARIAKYAKRVVCFDSEPEAQKRARALCSALEVLPGETINIVLDAKDVAEASLEERKQLREFLES